MVKMNWRAMAFGIACLGMALPAGAASAQIGSRNGAPLLIVERRVSGATELAQVPPPPGYRRYDRDYRNDRYDRDNRRHDRYDRRPPPRRTWGQGPAIIIAPPPPPRYRASSAHVRWCADRYRSYNPGSDTFRGNDGRNHRCNSPYR